MEVKEISEKLKAYFPEEDIQWRITATTQDKTKGLAVPYVDTRAIQRRLDDTVGIDGWKVSYRPIEDGFICSLSLKLNNEWITKEDGANMTDYEKIKGGISGAFKRTASSGFGIGRYIYDIPLTWIKIKKQGNSYVPDEKISLPSKYKLKEELTPYLELKMPLGKYLNHSLKEILEEDPLYLNYILKKSDQVPSQLVEACKVLKKEYMISWHKDIKKLRSSSLYFRITS